MSEELKAKVLEAHDAQTAALRNYTIGVPDFKKGIKIWNGAKNDPVGAARQTAVMVLNASMDRQTLELLQEIDTAAAELPFSEYGQFRLWFEVERACHLARIQQLMEERIHAAIAKSPTLRALAVAASVFTG